MKVKMFDKSEKRFTSVMDWENAKELIKEMKGDESKPEEYLHSAAMDLEDVYHAEVLTAYAKVALNRNAWNNYWDESEMMDVKICGYVKVYRTNDTAVVDLEAFLTDIWRRTGYEEDDMNIRGNFYTKWYTEQ